MRRSGMAGVIAIGAACAVLVACGSSDAGGPRAWEAGTAGSGAIQDMKVDAATGSLPVPIERPDGVPVFLPVQEADWSTPRSIVGGLEGSEHADLLAQHLGLAEDDLRSQLHGWSVALLPADTAVREYRTGDEQPRPAVLQAGTAVLVDEYAMPRVRIASGTALTPLDPAERDDVMGGVSPDWDGYDPDAVQVAVPLDEPQSALLYTNGDGEVFAGGIRDQVCADDEDRLVSCSVVAYVPYDDGDLQLPVAMANHHTPKLSMRSVDDRGKPAKAATQGSITDFHFGGPTYFDGAQQADREALRMRAFDGAFDVTGDGTPELVVWLASPGENYSSPEPGDLGAAEFMVFRRGVGGRLAPIPAPIPTGRSTAKVWAMDLGGTEYGYRCIDSGVEVIERDGDQQLVTPATWQTGRWVLEDPYTEPLDAPADPLEPLAFDCQDHAERAVQVDETGPDGVHPQDSGMYRYFTEGAPR